MKKRNWHFCSYAQHRKMILRRFSVHCQGIFFFALQVLQPVPVAERFLQTEATECMITTCPTDFAACGQSRYCASQTLPFFQAGALKDFRFRCTSWSSWCRVQNSIATKLYFLSMWHSEKSVAALPKNKLLAMAWKHAHQNGPAVQQLRTFPWIGQRICAVCARGLRRAQTAQIRIWS